MLARSTAFHVAHPRILFEMYSADIPPHLRVEATPLAHPQAIVQGDRWRFTVLTDGLLRAEWSDDGVFEDRATTFALHRDLPVPAFRVIDGDDTLEILTARLHLRYDRKPFSPSGLRIRPLGMGWGLEDWKFGEVEDLGGTARTLDGVNGRLPLESGVVSRKGVGVIDDSASMLFTDDGWVSPREGERTDLYVFAYAHDFGEALRALYALSGSQPVLPRWALGNWWSRYHRYTAGRLHRAARPLRARGRAVLGRRARHGLAPGRQRAARVQRRLDRLQLGARVLPRPRGLPRRGAPPRHEGHAEPPPRRRGARVRGRLPGDGRGPRPRPRAGREDRLRDQRPRLPRGVLRGAASPDGGAGRRLLVDGLAARSALPRHRRRPALDAQPLPLPRCRPQWRAPAPPVALRGAGQPPLPGRVLGRRRPQLGVARLPAGVHRDRVEHRLRVVEPRHRRPHVRLARRRAHRPLGAVRRVLAHPPAALDRQPLPREGALGLPRRDPRRARRRPPAARSPRAVPARDEPPRGHRRRSPRAAAVLHVARAPRGVRRPEPVHVRQRAARRADHLAARRRHAARSGHGLAAAGRVDRHPHRRRPAGRPHGRAAPRARLDPGAAESRRHPPPRR